MLRVTFVGHQSWIISAGNSHVLVDPLLDASFGAIPEAGLKVYPPRVFDWEAAPPITAVFITHEHDDHFQLASLNRLSRSIPIWLSSYSSSAAREILRQMGFQTFRAEPNSRIELGEVTLQTFSPDLLDRRSADEWDVLPFVAFDRERSVAFGTCVDLRHSTHMPRMVPREIECLATYTNNYSSRWALSSFVPPSTGALSPLAEIGDLVRDYVSKGPAPKALVTCGGGWCFSGDLAWLNHTFFPADSRAIAEGLKTTAYSHHLPLLSLLPGETLVLQQKKPLEVTREFGEFLGVLPMAEWPDRRYDPASPRATGVPPLFPARELTEAELDELRARLKELAGALVGSTLFLALNSLTEEELSGCARAYELTLQSGTAGEGYRLQYRTSETNFVPAPDQRPCVAGMICWAQDLLALLRGQATASLFSMGRSYEWARFRTRRAHQLALSNELWPLVHPLRLPDQFLTFYRQVLEKLPRPERLVPALKELRAGS